MTSRNSFFKLMMICIRNRVWGIGASCLLFFFGLPVWAVITAQRINDGIKDGYIMASMGSQLFRFRVFADANFSIFLFVIILAFFLALTGYGYLFNRQTIDVYHAMPIKRGKLFWANYLAGMIAFEAPYVAGILLAALIGQFSGLMTGMSYVVLLYCWFLHTIAFLMLYSITIIGCMLTGKAIVAGLGTIVLLVYGALVNWSINLTMDSFLDTFSSYTSDKLLSGMFSPIVYYAEAFGNVRAYRVSPYFGGKNVMIMIVLAIVATGISFYLYKIRKSEAAGVSMAFTRSMSVISILIMVPMGLLGGVFLYEVLSKIGWYIFGVAATLIVGHFVIQAIYFADFRSMFKNLSNIGISAAIVAVISGAFIFDLIGYDSYLPKKDQVAYGAVVSYNFQDSLEYQNIKDEVDEYGNPDYWINGFDYKLEHMKLTDIDTLLDLARAGIAGNEECKEWNDHYDELSEEEQNRNWTEFTICYTMKSGKKVYRVYNMDMDLNMDVYNRLYSNPEYKQGVYQLFDDSNASVPTTPVYYGPLGICQNFEMTEKQVEEFYNIYKEELLKQDAYDAQQHGPIGYFAREYKVAVGESESTYTLDQAYIYPSFKKSVAYLQKAGIDVYSAWDIDSIESVTVNDYNYDDSEIMARDENFDTEDSSVWEKEYTDMAQIKEILNVCESSDFVYFDSVLHSTESVDITVKYKPGKKAEDGSRGNSEIYMSVLKGKLPGFVKTDVQY